MILGKLAYWYYKMYAILHIFLPIDYAFVYVLRQALVNGNTGFDSSRSITDPPSHPVTPIPDCTANLFITNANCFDFVYSPNNSAIINVRP